MLNFLILLFPILIFAKQTLCLNMIVKDEKEVIVRCLESVKPVIDYWVIVDTGSTDGTQEIIRECLKDIPGELYERPWKGFGESRSEAFTLVKGKGDYILFMDADDILEFDGEPSLPHLSADLYNMWRGSHDFTYLKPQIVRGDLSWKWVGVTHEYLACDELYSSDTLENVRYLTLDGGASYRDLKKKFLTNIELLEKELEKDPGNVRSMFYLAESYRDAEENGKALECYQKRIQMGGWEEEIFWAKLQSALILEKLGLPEKVVREALIAAHEARLYRSEPIYYLTEHLNAAGEYSLAYEYIKLWSMIPKPLEKDFLFNMDWMDRYGILFQLSISSYYLGFYQESLEACEKLLAMQDIPEGWRSQTEYNRQFPLQKLSEIVQKAALHSKN